MTRGTIDFGQEVTWEATHFFVPGWLTSRVTVYDRPNRFRDLRCAALSSHYDHDRFFTAAGDFTTIKTAAQNAVSKLLRVPSSLACRSYAFGALFTTFIAFSSQ